MHAQMTAPASTTTGRSPWARRWYRIKQDRYLYLLILPGLLAVLVFSYFPMYGLQLAFRDYQAKLGVWDSPWIGFGNFAKFFSRSDAGYIIGNTLRIGFFQLLFSMPVPIVLALLLNELKHRSFKRGIQSVLYLPYFISWVVIYGLIYAFFSQTTGVFNKVIDSLGYQTVNVIGDPNKFRRCSICPISGRMRAGARSSTWRRSRASTSRCTRRPTSTAPTASSRCASSRCRRSPSP